MTKKYVVDCKTGIAGLQDFTAAEEAQKVTDDANAIVERQASEEAATQLATNKANAKAKLIAGEALTDAEADTIVI